MAYTRTQSGAPIALTRRRTESLKEAVRPIESPEKHRCARPAVKKIPKPSKRKVSKPCPKEGSRSPKKNARGFRPAELEDDQILSLVSTRFLGQLRHMKEHPVTRGSSHRYVSVLGKLPHRSEAAELEGLSAGAEAELCAERGEAQDSKGTLLMKYVCHPQCLRSANPI